MVPYLFFLQSNWFYEQQLQQDYIYYSHKNLKNTMIIDHNLEKCPHPKRLNFILQKTNSKKFKQFFNILTIYAVGNIHTVSISITNQFAITNFFKDCISVWGMKRFLRLFVWFLFLNNNNIFEYKGKFIVLLFRFKSKHFSAHRVKHMLEIITTTTIKKTNRGISQPTLFIWKYVVPLQVFI